MRSETMHTELKCEQSVVEQEPGLVTVDCDQPS